MTTIGKTTWADLAPNGLTHHVNMDVHLDWRSYDVLADVLVEKLPNLTRDSARILIELTHLGLPIILSWAQLLDTTRGMQVCLRMEAVIVTQLIPPTDPRPGLAGVPGHAHVRYVGFSQPIYLDKIVSAKVFSAT